MSAIRITTSPPAQDGFVWFREDFVNEAMRGALAEAVEAHGNKAKAIAWDIRAAFTKRLGCDQ